MASRIFLTATELNVFERLGTRELTAAEMAERIVASVRGTEILLNALVALSLLAKKGDRFLNLEAAADLLLPSGPSYQGGFGYAVHLWKAWSCLTDVVRSGRPADVRWTGKVKRDFALHMKRYAAGSAEAFVARFDCSEANRLLDVGGGTGSHVIAFAQRYPHLTAVLFDANEVALEIARDEIARLNLQDRISLKAGDFLVDDLGSDYDLALLSSIICILGEEESVSLLRRVKTSLRPGGQVVVRDSLVDESMTDPSAAAVFAVNMLVTTQSGRAYSYAQVLRWLKSLDFRELRRIPMGDSHLVVGRK